MNSVNVPLDIDTILSVFQDFGGSGVVHLLSGSMALIGCLLLGPRIGRFTECGRPNGAPVHSTPVSIKDSPCTYFVPRTCILKYTLI